MSSREISVAILTYNAEARVAQCLEAVLRQTRPADEIVVVDNASVDRTRLIIQDDFPQVRLVTSEENTGCSGGRNKQIGATRSRYVMIVDDDVFLDASCLAELEAAISTQPEAAIWSPRVCYDDDRTRIQFDGCDLHYIGEAILSNSERRLPGESEAGTVSGRARQLTDPSLEELAPLPDEPFVTPIQGGVAFLVDRVAVDSVGGYDESFFFGRTDGEFSYRLTLSGRQIYTVPRAVVYHRVKERGFSSVERQVCNRWTMILECYALRTLLVIAPALLAYEVALIVFLAMNRQLGAYLKGNAQVARNLSRILSKRRRVQVLRQRADRDLLSAGSINVRADIAKGKLVRMAHRTLNQFFVLYWRLARPLVG